MTDTLIAPKRTRTHVELPRRWQWLIRGFRRYCVRYVRKHIHAVRLSNCSHVLPSSGGPILVVLNHPCWWDPLIGVVLSRLFGDRDQFAAIDAVAVQKYPFFNRLGFVGVETGTVRGAARFLRLGVEILSQPNRAFWVTAQGRFTDVRERPIVLHSGVGHLASRLADGWVVPLAIEYVFWTERTPEALARFGEPLRVGDHPGLSGKAWTRLIETSLTRTLGDLTADAMTRDPTRFTPVIEGKSGVGGMYDVWRRLMAWARGKEFDPSHVAAMTKDRP